ncbi:MAG: nuclear transport factor 2 family protein [Rhodothermales bacterium]|nr:nuclear transport factor 2 family protein [Rhodothermales bacterium]
MLNLDCAARARFFHRTVFGTLALLLAACQPASDKSKNAPAPSAEEIEQAYVEVDDLVHRFGRMWEDEDMATFDQIVAHDEDLVIIGTDAAEQIIGYDTYRELRERQFASFENVEFDVRNRIIKVAENGRSAWFSEEFDLFLLAQGNPVSLEGMRLTGGLEKRDTSWVIVQLHTSVPVPGQAAEY